MAAVAVCKHCLNAYRQHGEKEEPCEYCEGRGYMDYIQVHDRLTKVLMGPYKVKYRLASQAKITEILKWLEDEGILKLPHRHY